MNARAPLCCGWIIRLGLRWEASRITRRDDRRQGGISGFAVSDTLDFGGGLDSVTARRALGDDDRLGHAFEQVSGGWCLCFSTVAALYRAAT